MISTIRSEIRKLLSVRSTYILLFVVVAIVSLLSFYVEGVWGKTGSPAGNAEAGALKEIIGSSVGLAAVFIAIIAILQAGHEFRYNTISYTLTANPSRTKVFLSKLLVLGSFAVITGLVVALLAVGGYLIGLNIRGAELVPQNLDWVMQLLRVMLYSFVYGALGFALVMLFRNLIGAIVLFLVMPTFEPLLGLILKDNAKYLPISTFDHIMGVAIGQTDMTPNIAAGLSILYIASLLLVAWFVFLRRDAN